MACRQVYGFNQDTNRVEHHYVDLGRMSAAIGHSRPVVATFVAAGSAVNMKPNGGSKQTRLDPLKDAA